MAQQDSYTIKLYRTAAWRNAEVDGKQTVELYMVDVAEIIETGKRKPKIKLVAEDRPTVLRDLASWVELGEPSIEEAKREAGDAS
jgi:hypothetical protein